MCVNMCRVNRRGRSIHIQMHGAQLHTDNVSQSKTKFNYFIIIILCTSIRGILSRNFRASFFTAATAGEYIPIYDMYVGHARHRGSSNYCCYFIVYIARTLRVFSPFVFHESI